MSNPTNAIKGLGHESMGAIGQSLSFCIVSVTLTSSRMRRLGWSVSPAPHYQFQPCHFVSRSLDRRDRRLNQHRRQGSSKFDTRASSRLDFSRLDYPSPLDCTRTLLSVCPLSGSILHQIDQVRFKFQVRGSDERQGVTTRLVRGSIASIGMLIFPLLVLPDVLTPFVCLDRNISAIVD
jgi:hypothetical protein